MSATCLSLAVTLVLWVTASAAGEAALECGRSFVVRFPRISMAPGERVVGVTLTVKGGSVVGVSNIPRDWGISVEPEVSGVASVSGNPQHGVGALVSTDALPSVVVRGHTCSTSDQIFALSAVIHVTRDFASTRSIDLEQRMLRIQQAPNSTLQLPGAPSAGAGYPAGRGAPGS